MTTKQTHPAAAYIPYRRDFSDDFCYLDPEPRAYSNVLQSPVIDECGHLLRDHFAGQPSVHVDTGGEVYYDRQDRARGKTKPDLYVVFGVDAAEIFDRRSYLIWEAGKSPDFALKVASDTTYDVDIRSKPALYARVGIGEYWRFDPTGGELYGDALAGDILANRVYQPIPLITEADGMNWGYSPALDLCLCSWGRRLRFYDRKTGGYLRSIGEERAAHRQTAAELDEERASRRAAEEREEQLQVVIRRLQGQ